MSGVPHTERAGQNGFCCPQLARSYTPGWERLTSGKLLPPTEGHSGRHVGLQSYSEWKERRLQDWRLTITVPFFSQTVKGREVPMRWRDAGLFCATDQSPQHSFLFLFLSSICVCAAIWKSVSSNGYVQTLDLPGFPYLGLGTAGCKGLCLQGRACTCVRNLSTNMQVACVMNKQTRKWV